MRASNSIAGYTAQINENIGSHTNLNMNVQSSSVLNSQKETI